MKIKIILLLWLLCPFFLLAQTNLVRWYNADLSPTLLENHLSASSITNANTTIAKQEWGSEIFYQVNGASSTSTIDTNKYIQFTIAPKTGYSINLNSFQLNAKKGGGTQKFQIRYSKNASFSSYNTLLTETDTPSSYTNYNISFPASTIINSGETLYVRVYVYNTYNDFRLECNNAGTVGPTFMGSVSISPLNIATAFDDKTGTTKNTSLTINILNNDDYKYTAPLTQITVTSQPENGTVTVNGTNNITYTPNNNFVGYDNFYYTLKNSIGTSNTAKVELQVIDNTGAGIEKTLVRWRNAAFTPYNYVTGVTGNNMAASELTLTSSNDGTYNVFSLENVPNPSVNNGNLKETNYVQLAIKAGTSNDYTAYLKNLNIDYRAQAGTGNITIKFSKDPSFSNGVYTLLNNVTYNNSWAVKSLSFDNSASFLYPGETMYIRLYAYNTWNKFFLRFNASAEMGPAVTGNLSPYHPESCTTTATWSSSGWSQTPSIYKKAIITADYNTAVNGNFEACSIKINSGKLIISKDNYIKIDKTIEVTGTGSIEVQSDGNLIQVNKNIVNTGSIIVKREAKIKRLDYVYWGSPVSDQSFKAFSPNTLAARFYSYNEVDNSFATIADLNTNFVAGKGYTIRAPNNYTTTIQTFVGEFKGIPNNGDIILPVAYTNATKGKNMVANPYPSNIDLRLLHQKNTAVSAGTFYFWTNDANSWASTSTTANGSYGTYTANQYAVLNVLGAIPAATKADASPKIPSAIIKPGQGFIIQASASGNLVFDNTMRTTAITDGVNTSSFFNRNSSGASKKETSTISRYWLSLTSEAGAKNTILVGYVNDANNTYDANYDAEILSDTSDNIYSILDNKKFAIQGRNSSTLFHDIVTIGVSEYMPGSYTIKIEKKDGVFEANQSIYLKDKLENKIVNLLTQDYTFRVDSAGVQNNRFEIVYQNESSLATDNLEKQKVLVFKDLDSFSVLATEKISEILVYDAAGKLMIKINPSAAKAKINTVEFPKGIYILKILTAGNTITKKIIK